MAIRIDFHIMQPEDMRHLLKQSAMTDRIRQLPSAKRKQAMAEMELMDDDDEEAERDREERADLVEQTRPGNAPKVTAEDIPAQALKNAKKGPPVPKKKAK